MNTEELEKKLADMSCKHSAYKMLPVLGGIFGIAWQCTKCHKVIREIKEA